MDAEGLENVMGLLAEAEAPVRILRHLAWPASVRERFFADGARRLPRVEYPAFDPRPVRERVQRARALLGPAHDPVARWLARQADAIETGADLLAAAGTPAFGEHSRALYGAPGTVQPDETSTPLALARQLETLTRPAPGLEAPPAPRADLDADGVAASIRAALDGMFGAEAPRVLVVDELSANALAGPEHVRIRRGARFSSEDLAQLVQHEAYVHVLTTLNGRAQPALPILASTHPHSTRTQEGLAVFAEFITGHMTPMRFRRLADRVHAIQMALDGADFVEVYDFFVARSDDPGQSFENARRVFRGGPVTGGAPFTKDIVYLDGLARVHNFMRTVVALGRADLLPLLFVGKLDIEDVPALARLTAEGLCRPPRHLPPWMADPRFLLSHLAYSAFLNTVDLGTLRDHYARLIAGAPYCAPATQPSATGMQ